MDAREANRRTLAAYEAHVDQYVAGLSAAMSPTEVELLDRIAAAVPGGTVLEIGSGPGHDALELERRGLTVRRTDATVAFVERLRAHGHDVDVLDALTDDLGGPYDAIVGFAVFLHFSRAEFAKLLQRATKAAAWLAFTVKEGDGDEWTTKKLDAPRWFVFWREPALRDALAAAGWEPVWLVQNAGRFDGWLSVLARRA